jgi:hypothetical protein
MSKPARRGHKTQFVARHLNLPAGEIVALARKEGIALTPNVVHSMKSVLKKDRAQARMTEAESSRVIRRVGHVPPPPSDKRALLRRLVIQIGYDTALAEIDSVGEALESIERKVLK